ncbi:hypothetical protein [Algoriphagus aquimarinus]|uniref:Uncharacterized protein n=1 Tax=Algoriphagus aquimarinus TaxID=237018 RepID=A0A5C7AHQ3_9BACT|nr:hypothetical protein [Algoriphagus aquimarinus]TXE04768.1 hypothetical protein ESV85_18685 [Algoriphagus aquimarinus]
MRILGIPVYIQIRKSALIEKHVKQLSYLFNKGSDHTKKQVVFVYILLSVGMCSALLIKGLSKEPMSVLQIPEWESPLILHDSLYNNSQTKRAYETDN